MPTIVENASTDLSGIRLLPVGKVTRKSRRQSRFDKIIEDFKGFISNIQRFWEENNQDLIQADSNSSRKGKTPCSELSADKRSKFSHDISELFSKLHSILGSSSRHSLSSDSRDIKMTDPDDCINQASSSTAEHGEEDHDEDISITTANYFEQNFEDVILQLEKIFNSKRSQNEVSEKIQFISKAAKRLEVLINQEDEEVEDQLPLTLLHFLPSEVMAVLLEWSDIKSLLMLITISDGFLFVFNRYHKQILKKCSKVSLTNPYIPQHFPRIYEGKDLFSMEISKFGGIFQEFFYLDSIVELCYVSEVVEMERGILGIFGNRAKLYRPRFGIYFDELLDFDDQTDTIYNGIVKLSKRTSTKPISSAAGSNSSHLNPPSPNTVVSQILNDQNRTVGYLWNDIFFKIFQKIGNYNFYDLLDHEDNWEIMKCFHSTDLYDLIMDIEDMNTQSEDLAKRIHLRLKFVRCLYSIVMKKFYEWSAYEDDSSDDDSNCSDFIVV